MTVLIQTQKTFGLLLAALLRSGEHFSMAKPCVHRRRPTSPYPFKSEWALTPTFRSIAELLSSSERQISLRDFFLSPLTSALCDCFQYDEYTARSKNIRSADVPSVRVKSWTLRIRRCDAYDDRSNRRGAEELFRTGVQVYLVFAAPPDYFSVAS